MPSPRPKTKCLSSRVGDRYCAASYEDHDPVTHACPDGAGTTYRFHRYSTKRVSVSFSEREVRALRDLCSAVLNGTLRGDSALTWAKQHARDLGGLAHKALAMRASLERRNGRGEVAEAAE